MTDKVEIILHIFTKLPGYVEHIPNGTTVHHKWLIAMGLYDTLDILTGVTVHYGR